MPLAIASGPGYVRETDEKLRPSLRKIDLRTPEVIEHISACCKTMDESSKSRDPASDTPKTFDRFRSVEVSLNTSSAFECKFVLK